MTFELKTFKLYGGAIWGLKLQKAPGNYFKLVKVRIGKINQYYTFWHIIENYKKYF